MEFLGYTTIGMIGTAHIVYTNNGNYVINDGGHFKLAIRIPQCNKVEKYALFLWDEFVDDNDEERNRIIQLKAEETIRFFQETVGVINNHIPTLIYNEVSTILKHNEGKVADSQETLNTEIISYEGGISLEYDFGRNVWYVHLKGIMSIMLNNESSARRVCQLLLKDISNYIRFRWYDR